MGAGSGVGEKEIEGVEAGNGEAVVGGTAGGGTITGGSGGGLVVGVDGGVAAVADEVDDLAVVVDE